MAYVRKVRTASGAVAVQVARKDRGKVVILAHLGSAHTDADLGILLHAAQQVVLDGQAALDFEVSARAQSIADVADFRDGGLICALSGPAAAAAVVPPGRTLGTNCRLLYEVLAHVYGWLGFDAVGDGVFRDLVIARIVEPTSKIDALRVLGDLGASLVSYKTIDRHVRGLHASSARDVVTAKCFEYSRDCGGLSLLLYDTTTLHFKAPGDLESHFHWNGDVFTDGQIIDTVTPRHANSTVNDCNKRAEPVWDRDAQPAAWRAIWAYSAKRARRDQKTLAAQEARARAIVAGEKNAKTARFVKTKGDERVLDEANLTCAQSLVGLKGYVTNVPVTVMPAAEVIAKYHDLWHVEKSFRMSKSDLDARPMFNRMHDAIEAHLTIVFTALAVSHAIQSRTGLSIAKVIKLLRPLRSATININGATQTFPPEIPDTEAKILTDLGFNPGYY